MEEQPSIEALVYPKHTNTFAIPNDSALKLVYGVYKPSPQTTRLQSERARTVYPEALIENDQLGTLVDLCVRALARKFGANPIPIIANEHALMQIHYDALDVDMPLAECYHISEERFWKRLVLAKHSDKSLALKCDFNWKNLGVSMKYVELVEKCPAEDWPEEEMKNLAITVKDFVNEMHIKRLQSLREHSFEKYFSSNSESSSEEDVENSSADEAVSSVPTSDEEVENEKEEPDLTEKKSESQLEFEKKMAKKERKKARQELREAKQKAKETKEAKRKLREASHAKKKPAEENSKNKNNPKNFTDNEIPDSGDKGEDKVNDKFRNKEIYLKYKKQYNYPPEHCHHIDLGFVQYFTNLESFTIEFLGPIQNRNFHSRHMNFSHDDIKRLATGISLLPKLRIFRLRNSRMDTEKLITLCRGLSALVSLETIDLGYNNLTDDCGTAFANLFANTSTVRYLELESNQFGENVLRQLGKSLQDYKHGHLEYLGLSRNPVNDVALHALISAILGSKHISNLSLRGAKHLTKIGLSCCIANELLRQHTPLLKLDLCAVKISQLAADEIIKAMHRNKTILEFNCGDCGLDEESEKDIKVLLKRNVYIAENPYLSEKNITNEEIESWLNRTKNPILLKVLAEREKQHQCLENRRKEFIPSPLSSIASGHESLNLISQMYGRPLTPYSSLVSSEVQQKQEPFVYSANEFNEKEFLEHVYQPGPEERFYYFKMHKRKYVVRDTSNIKNISMA